MTLQRELKVEVASIIRDPNVVVYGGGILRATDDTLLSRGGGRGLKIYDEIERDTHVYAVMQKRKMAVIGREWTVEAASEDAPDQKAADTVRAQFEAMAFDQACLGMMDAVLKGYAVGEVMWDVTASEVVASEIRIRDQRRFVFTVDGDLRLLTLNDMVDGEPVPEKKFVVHRFGAKDGSPYGLGLGTRLFWPALFKREGLSFWLRFIEKYAMPTAVGKYPSGATPEDKTALLNAALAMSSEAGVIIPEGMLLELLEAQKSGSISSYETLVNYLDAQISEAVLGETLSTNAGKIGSQALGTVHNAVREELTDADADLLCSTLNQTVVRWISEFNVPGARPPRVWREKPADENAAEDLLIKRTTRVKGLLDLGLEPEAPGVIEDQFPAGFKYVGRPKPQLAPPPPITPPDPAFAAPGAEDDDPTAAHIEALSEPADAVISNMVAAIRALLDEVKDLDELGRRLIELYPTLTAEKLGDLLAEGMVAAELAGRFEVDEAASS